MTEKPKTWTIGSVFLLYKLSQHNRCYTKLTMPVISCP